MLSRAVVAILGNRFFDGREDVLSATVVVGDVLFNELHELRDVVGRVLRDEMKIFAEADDRRLEHAVLGLDVQQSELFVDVLETLSDSVATDFHRSRFIEQPDDERLAFLERGHDLKSQSVDRSGRSTGATAGPFPAEVAGKILGATSDLDGLPQRVGRDIADRRSWCQVDLHQLFLEPLRRLHLR